MDGFVGTSGWHYEHWQGLFYPPELDRSRWLEHYSRRFGTVEINNSFYRMPSETAFTAWRRATPESFVFAVKASRYITHIKRLRDSRTPVDNFIARARLLGSKLGPVLYQLPPGLPRDDARLEAFLQILPRGVRHVFEFRHESWLVPEVLALLRRHSAGFCVFDMPGLQCPLAATAKFAYIRFHGSTALYSTRYTDEELAGWAERLRGLDAGVEDMYIYFNNDARAYAVENAVKLKELLER